MSTDEPFIRACYPEPLNDNGEKLIASMMLQKTIDASGMKLRSSR